MTDIQIGPEKELAPLHAATQGHQHINICVCQGKLDIHAGAHARVTIPVNGQTVETAHSENPHELVGLAAKSLDGPADTLSAQISKNNGNILIRQQWTGPEGGTLTRRINVDKAEWLAATQQEDN